MLTFKQVEAIVSEVSCNPYAIRVFMHNAADAVWYLQAWLWRVDKDTGKEGWGHGGKYLVSSFSSTREEIVQKALAACLAYAEHEVRENFTWRGRKIFGPHMNHDKLWEIANNTVERAKN